MRFKRVARVGALGLLLLGLTPGVSNAGITPDPYSSSTDSGRLFIFSSLGNGACDVRAITWRFGGIPTGAIGSLNALALQNCTGVVRYAISLSIPSNPVAMTLTNGITSFTNFRVLLIDVLGGQCLYGGSLSGGWSSPARAISVTNASVPLVTRLPSSVFCVSSVQIVLNTDPIGATITR